LQLNAAIYSLTLFGIMRCSLPVETEERRTAMDFSLSEEQALLAESLQRYVQNEYQFETRQQIAATPEGMDKRNWRKFGELGWLGMMFSEADGGYGGSAVDLMVIMEQVGKGLVLEPFLSSLVLAGGLIANAGNDEQKRRWLAPMIEGELIGCFAFAEKQSRFNLHDVSATAQATASGYALNGSKAVVLGAPNADLIVVSARTSGDVRDAEGVSLFVVTPNAAGVTLTDYVTVDGGRAAEVAFENVELGADALLGEIGAASSVIERVVDEALLAVGAEAVGAMEVLYKATVEYAKQRKQFGVPIGSFQVLQHRMVDMFMAHEQAKSLMYMAAIRLDEDDAAEARKAASAFKVQVGKSGRAVGQGAVQIHGGMGMTDELNIGHYFKRLTVIETLFGNTDHHLKRFASI